MTKFIGNVIYTMFGILNLSNIGMILMHIAHVNYIYN